MRLVIDLQGAQAASRERGIGRYSLQLAHAIARHAGDHQVLVALNGAFPETIEPIRASFANLLPQERIVVWESPCPIAGFAEANDLRRQAAERIREAFLASLRPDWVVVTSLFEGFLDNAATNIGPHAAVPTAVVLYDLIPLIHAERYFKDAPVFERWYREKVGHLRRADLLLSISESSGQEAIDHLGCEPTDVVPIGTDCDERFRPIGLSDPQTAQLRATYGIDRSFVMYTGGIDHRKNIEGLIRAYAALPSTIRRTHQLAVVCAAQPQDRERLLGLARDSGLETDELVLTGFVPDDDLLTLYNSCTLFVFPSWHEGFGLPALEAMRCGKAVLAANTSSLPEVLGREDALFDPFDESAMAALIERALSDGAFRQDLEHHGLMQSRRFSWDKTARRALAALDIASRRRKTLPAPVPAPSRQRPRLAYVSPLPPDKSGIADYSAELLPELTRWYEVEVIVPKPEVIDAALRASYPIRSTNEFRARAASYDRVLYHFGNSSFHEHMFALLEAIPGVVVLHDFFLSGIQAHRDAHGWAQALLQSHGYRAVRDRYSALDTAEVVWRYPANLPVLQAALGVIVHSDFSRTLAREWYGDDAAADWAVIPHLRVPVTSDDREASRLALGLSKDDLLVCSFGLLGPQKLNELLLEAWLASPLANAPHAKLVFVGENDEGDYGRSLMRRIRDSGMTERICITGWVDTVTFRRYLAAADIGVQLRTLTRGETSGTVLDCMNHGLATIVNAHGSISDLKPAGVLMLPDKFATGALIDALTKLARDASQRRDLGERAREVVRTHHAPHRCAERYLEAIEGFYQRAATGLPGLLNDLVRQALREKEWPHLATSLSRNFPPAPRRGQLLVDVSELVQRDVKSGIQRVVRAILREWLECSPAGFQVEPVYATAEKPGYRYARRWTSRFLDIPEDWANDDPVEAWPGDMFIGLDFLPHIVPAQQAYLQRWRDRGVRVCFVVYDLLPVQLPQMFPAGAQATHQRWLESICNFDGLAAISRTVADEMRGWLLSYGPKLPRPPAITCFSLGADIAKSVPTTGISRDAEFVLAKLQGSPTFLMVGTVEPRKGYAQTLEAFEQLWAKGVNVNLVIVGKKGWMVDALLNKLRTHHLRGERLFWLEGISDEYLEKVYTASTCMIAASYGEGFGLPLIEAAQHRLPIIARNIPIFREVASGHASYFDADDATGLAEAIKDWLTLYRDGQHPKSDFMPRLTWKQSAEILFDVVQSAACTPKSMK